MLPRVLPPRRHVPPADGPEGTRADTRDRSAIPPFCRLGSLRSLSAWPAGPATVRSFGLGLCLVLGVAILLPPPALAATGSPVVTSSVFDGGYSPPDEPLTLSPGGEAKARALALFYRGAVRRAKGDARGALDDFRGVLEIDPGNLDLASRTATDLAKSGEGAQALALLEEALRRNPDDPRALLLLSDHCFTFDDGSGELAQRGLGHVLEAVELFPLEALAHSQLIAYYLTEGDRENASASLAHALDQDSPDPAYWLALGRLAQGVWPFRFGETETREDNLAKVAAIYERALTLPAAGTGVRFAVAEFFRDVRQFDRAAELFREVYEAEPDHLAARESHARMLAGLERHDEALAAFENLVAINPFDARVRTIVADYHWARYSEELRGYENLLSVLPDMKVRALAEPRKPDDGHGRRAATHYLEAIRLGEPTVRNFLLSSLILTETGQLELAESTLQRARFIHPDTPEFPRELARVYREKEQLGDALDAYRDAEEIASRSRSVEEMDAFLDERFYFAYGATAEQHEDYDLAADLLRKSIAETPEESPENAAITYNYLGYMWLEQGVNIDEAGELIRYALDAEPNNSSYVDSIGWYHFHKGDFDRALEELLRAEQLMAHDYDIAFSVALSEGLALEADRDPNAGVDPEVLDHIAQAYSALGDPGKAVEYLERAVREESATEAMRQRLEEYRAGADPNKAPKPDEQAPADPAGPAA